MFIHSDRVCFFLRFHCFVLPGLHGTDTLNFDYLFMELSHAKIAWTPLVCGLSFRKMAARRRENCGPSNPLNPPSVRCL